MPVNEFHIMSVCGFKPSDLWLLVHIVDAEDPDDLESYRAMVTHVQAGRALFEYSVPEWIPSMWQAPSGTLYTASTDGRIHHNSGGVWRMVELGKRYTTQYIWGLDDETIYCCGLKGALFRKQGVEWVRVVTKQRGDFYKIGGAASDDLYLLGENGKMIHYDGHSWSKINSPTNYQLYSILCLSATEVYVCGENGIVFRGSWESWERIEGVEYDLYSLASYRGRVYIAGDSEGLFFVEDNTVTPFQRDVLATQLQVIGDRLFAYGDNILHEFDGVNWSRREFDFETLLETPSGR